MTLLTQTCAQVVADAPVSDLLEHWVGEQLQDADAARRTRPCIGFVAASGILRDGGWPVYGGDAPTMHAILEGGGFPCLIPAVPLLEGYNLSQLLADDHTCALFFDMLWPVVRDLDGLVFTGGGDLCACLYGQQSDPQADAADIWRDVWERYLALLAWVLCLPTLGICRGMHLMNVALGGSLYQDLRTQWPKDRPPLVRHRARGRVSSSTWVTHPVQLARPDSRLARAVNGKGELDRPAFDGVLSMHHQAVETLAPGLIISATAPDGVIEAFEETAPSRWWVATQFHPEWSTHLHWVKGLFGAFIDASRAYSAVSREEIEPLRCEIREWLRQRDHALHLRAETAAFLADSPIIPITRRASLLTCSSRKAE